MGHSDINEDAPKEKEEELNQQQQQPPGQAGPAVNDEIILATAGYDNSIKFWSAHTGVCTRTHQHPDSQVNCMGVTPDGTMLVAGGYQRIRMYDLTSSNLNFVVNYEGISKNVMAVGCQEDGKWMYSCGEDNCARIWDLKMRNLSCQRAFQTNAPVNAACLHPNQQELIVGDQSGVVHRWNLKNDQSEQWIPDPGHSAIQSIDIDPKGQYMAVVNYKGICYVWSLKTGDNEATVLQPKVEIPAHQSYGLSCKFSPDSSLLATTSADMSANIYRISHFDNSQISPTQHLTSQNLKWVWDCAFTADSKYLITGSSDGVARLWNLETGNVQLEYQGHSKAITCLAFRDVSKIS
eukprot:TRINITY_DN1826_c0_g1_i1.p1 TRINITY_DN1826_c0_g1~~TRINITY_DN1826_c0_g1_i1.p1  ORF type:complete len:350 (+),score=44.03 TRINITY_DN1826_c0_g1_i1:50-1099(+)